MSEQEIDFSAVAALICPTGNLHEQMLKLATALKTNGAGVYRCARDISIHPDQKEACVQDLKEILAKMLCDISNLGGVFGITLGELLMEASFFIEATDPIRYANLSSYTQKSQQDQ